MVTIQFLPYHRIEFLSSDERVKALLKEVKDSKILLLEGRLKPEEEALLITTTMQQIDKRFKGIELAVVQPSAREAAVQGKLRHALSKWLLGNRTGFTVIGPAALVKEIKKDPERIELLMRK